MYLDLADIWSLGFSAIALLLSFLTLYREYFYKKTALVGQIVHISAQAEEDSGMMEFDYAFSNLGNREVLIREIDMNLIPWPSGGGTPLIESMQLPTVIKPGEIKLINFKTNSQYIYDLGTRNISIEFSFEPVSSEGKVYSMQHKLDPCPSEEAIPQSWFEPFKLKNIG